MSVRYEWTLTLRLRPDTPATFLAELRYHLGLTDQPPEHRELDVDWPCLLPILDDTRLVGAPGELHVRTLVLDDVVYEQLRDVSRWLARWSLTQGRIGVVTDGLSPEPWLHVYVQDGHAYIGDPGGSVGAFDAAASPFTLPRTTG